MGGQDLTLDYIKRDFSNFCCLVYFRYSDLHLTQNPEIWLKVAQSSTFNLNF